MMKNTTCALYVLEESEFILAKAKRQKNNQLCFAVMLKHFQLEGHHPRATKYIDPSLITCLAKQLQVKTCHFDLFDWEGRSTERYRDEIRHLCGYRLANQSDIAKVKIWLGDSVFSQGAKRQTHLPHAQQYFKERKIEPPSTQELIRQIQSAYHDFEEALFSKINSQLSPMFCEIIDKIEAKSLWRDFFNLLAEDVTDR